jgi:hypothetical protein
MEELITIYPDSKDMKITEKNEDRTCEVEIKYRGLFKGFLESLSSNGTSRVRITEKIEDR